VLLGNWGFKYSDIVHGVFLDRFSPDLINKKDELEQKWYNPELYLALVNGTKSCPIPYIDYRFEYPPIVGILWGVSTCIAIQLVFPQHYTEYDYSTYIEKAAEVHFIIQSVFLGTALVFTAIYMYRFAVLLRLSHWRVIIFLLLPSTLLYTVYNWDIITVALILIAIYYFFKEKYLYSGLLLGLAISTKLLPLVLALVLSYEVIQRILRKKLVSNTALKFFLSLIITAGLPFVVLGFLSYKGLLDMFQHHAEWYCENCLYLLLNPDPWSPLHRILAMIIGGSTVMLTLIIPLKNLQNILRSSFLAMLISTLFNYVFTPQMILLISPLAILALDTKLLDIYILSDIANFGIIATFFKDLEIRRILGSFLGVEVKYSPWTIDSPVQWLAMIRNITLLIIWIYVLSISLKTLSSQLDENTYIASTEVKVYGKSENHDIHKGS